MIRVEHGDCLEVFARLASEGVTVDSIVTDPPYGLEFMGKEWDGADGFRRSLNVADAGRDNVFGRVSQKAPEYRTGANWQAGGRFSKPGIGERQTDWPSFSATSRFGAANPTCGRCGGRLRGKKRCACSEPEWKPIGKRRNSENEGLPNDMTGAGLSRHMETYQEWSLAWARQALAILKPGGHMLVFGGTRTWHRLACAIEDAGFEVRDTVCWLHGQGFPKSRDVSKAIDAALDAEREVVEQIRVQGGGTEHINRANHHVHDYRPGSYQKGENVLDVTVPATDEARRWQGWGTALKPAFEPIIVARKPLEGTVAANVLKHGTGAINIDGCRIEGEQGNGVWGTSNATIALEDNRRMFNASPGTRNYRSQAWRQATAGKRTVSDGAGWGVGQGGDSYVKGTGATYTTVGRWPANVVHDGSEEVLAAFPQADSSRASGNPNDPRHGSKDRVASSYDWHPERQSHDFRDRGSAARFFFAGKADREDRWGSRHPTVKPVELVRWLMRLVTPPKGLVLDCFAGSGTGGVAALAEGFNAILIEREAEYIADIRERIAFYQGKGRHSVVSKNRNRKAPTGPLL